MEHIAEAIHAPTSIEDALVTLTRGAAEAVPGADHASISVRSRGGALETIAATDALIERLDARQYQLREGPCYAAATTEALMVSYDLPRDPRWPKYGPAAASEGVNAQMAVVLTDNGAGRTALNLYAARPHEFSPDSVDLAQLFALHASVAMGVARTVDNLSAAVSSRQILGQAMGIVMERYQIDSERAFGFLSRASQHSTVALRDVAAQIVDGHNGRRRPRPF
jgi:hypothetical protein